MVLLTNLLGNVITDGFQSIHADIDRAYGLPEGQTQALYLSKYSPAMDKKALSRHEYLGLLATMLDIPEARLEAQLHDRMRVQPAVWRVISLFPGPRVVAAEVPEELYRRLDQRFHFRTLFNGAIISGQDKLEIASPKVFQRAMAIGECRPDDLVCVFSSPYLAELAVSLGYYGVHYPGPENWEFAASFANLSGLTWSRQVAAPLG